MKGLIHRMPMCALCTLMFFFKDSQLHFALDFVLFVFQCNFSSNTLQEGLVVKEVL